MWRHRHIESSLLLRSHSRLCVRWLARSSSEECSSKSHRSEREGPWYVGTVDEDAFETGEGTGSGRRVQAVARIGTTRVGSASDDDHEGSERPEPVLRLGHLRK